MMDKMIAEFPDQLGKALEIGGAAEIRPLERPIGHALICGMGGSAIGGNLVQGFLKAHLSIPILVNKDYALPAYVGEQSLCIFSSYSGNTEETVAAFDKALGTGARIICVTSGGKLLERAKANGLDYIQVPGGSPSPRATLGFSVVQLLTIFHKLGLTDKYFLNEIRASQGMLKTQQEEIKRAAQDVADALANKTPVIYAADQLEPVILRFRQQINENAKLLSWASVFPEMNHNELVGWRQTYKELAVVVLKSNYDHPRNRMRMDISLQIIHKCTPSIIEIEAQGNSPERQAFYFIHLTDWISFYLADNRSEIDPVEVKVIDYLKGELAKAN
ncbi:MAG: bifunctional phosphoglucose/phosphomannose isomerase [Bacteroidota bacterium]